MTDKRFHILVVVNVYRPDLGGGVLFSDLCEGLADRGIRVTARCAVPYYPEWKDKTQQNGVRIHRYEENDVWVERYGLYIPSNPGSLSQRLLYEASFFGSLLRKVPRRQSYDMIMAFCPLVGAVAYATLAKTTCRCPLWLNVQDLSADAAAAGGISKNSAFNKILSATQQYLFNRADVWSTISPVMQKRLEKLRRNQQPVLYLPNWLHTSLARTIDQLSTKRGRLPDDTVRLLYSGNIGAKQGLLRFCKQLHHSDFSFFFRIQGDGSHGPEIRRWIEDTRDPRFVFRELTDERGLADALFDADLFVITEKPGSGGSFIPSKLIPALASGTPVLAISDVNSPLGQEITTSLTGPHFQWSQSQDMIGLLQSIPDNPDLFVTWQRNAENRATFFDRKHVIDRYASTIKGIITQGSVVHLR